MGFEEASPIQSESIPPLLEGRDLVGSSQTGSGKTAAFGIPAIQCVDTELRQPQVLILCPTRELAVQVAEEMAKLAAFRPGLRELPIYGGASYERQFRGLDQGAQVVIGTPGRLMDHLKRGSLKLDALKMVVMDEADRMLDMGFVEDIREILEQCPAGRQTVCFSATFPPQIRDLIDTFTQDPVSVRIESQQMTVPSIDQSYYEVERRSKIDALCRIIDYQDLKFGIIFCATKLMCDDLSDHLAARGFMTERLHGDLSQAMRERVLARFKKHDIEFLIATDVAARGLDVDDVEVVFNYDLPHDGEDYVHRIGRTGRAGRDGRAITLVAGREIYKLQHIMRFIGTRIRRERVPTLEELDHKRSNVLLERVRATLERGSHGKYEEFVDRLLEAGYTPTDIATALFQIVAGEGVNAEDVNYVAPPLPEPEPPKPAPVAPKPKPAPKYAKPKPPMVSTRDKWERAEREFGGEKNWAPPGPKGPKRGPGPGPGPRPGPGQGEGGRFKGGYSPYPSREAMEGGDGGRSRPPRGEKFAPKPGKPKSPKPKGPVPSWAPKGKPGKGKTRPR